MNSIVARLLSVVFLVSTPAVAEFTDAEKQQVIVQLNSLTDAAGSAYWAMQHASQNRQAAGEVASYVGAVLSAWQTHHYAVNYLLDMDGSFNQFTADGVLAGPRADVVSLALSGIQSPGYNFAQTKMGFISGTSTALTNAQVLLARAVAGRASIDTTLPYEEPRLAVNLSLIGVTRERSPAIGPHGDYRMIGFAAAQWIRHSMVEWFQLATGTALCSSWYDNTSKGPAFMAGHILLESERISTILGLAAGIIRDTSALSLSQHLETMIAGGTTARPDEFFFTQIQLEAMLSWTHVGDEPFDVNGRHTLRGLTYDLEVINRGWGTGIDYSETYCTTENQFPFIKAMTAGSSATGSSWGAMDNLSYHGLLILKFFPVFPPPGPGGGDVTCGPDTTLVDGVCVANPCPDCPPPDECPTVVPGLEILPDRIQAKCTEVL